MPRPTRPGRRRKSATVPIFYAGSRRSFPPEPRNLAGCYPVKRVKTLPEGIGEVRRALAVIDYFAGEAFRSLGHFLPGLRDGFDVIVTRATAIPG